MTGPFGTTAGPWAAEEPDKDFTGGMYDTWLSGPDDTIICACWDNDKRAIAQVPALLTLAQAVADWVNIEDVRDMARAIVRELESE